MCIQTGKTMSDSQRMKFATDQFYFKTAEEMAQVFRELPDAVSRTVAIADRCNVKIQRVSESVSGIQGSGGPHDGFIFRKGGARGICHARAACSKQLAKRESPAAAAGGVREPADRRNRDDQEDALRGLLPDRLGFHSLRARAGRSGGAGTRFGGGKPGELRAAHHGRRSAAIRSAFRALPQSRARLTCPISISISACGGAAK